MTTRVLANLVWVGLVFVVLASLASPLDPRNWFLQQWKMYSWAPPICRISQLSGILPPKWRLTVSSAEDSTNQLRRLCRPDVRKISWVIQCPKDGHWGDLIEKTLDCHL